jgi:hypothetical protein
MLDKKIDSTLTSKFLDDYGIYIPDITSDVKEAKANSFYYQIQIGGCSCGILDHKKDELKVLFNEYIESHIINIMVNEYDDNLHCDIQLLINKASNKNSLRIDEFLELTSHRIEYNVLYQLLRK